MYKLIASDLDGTLLKKDKTISQETIDIIDKLTKQGVNFVASTGRTHYELPENLKNIKGIRYAITVNGGGIYDYEQEKYLYEKTIKKETVLKLLDFCQNLPVHPTCVINGRRFMPGPVDGTPDPHIAKVAVQDIVKTAFFFKDLISEVEKQPSDIQKLLIYPDYAEDKVAIIASLSKEFPELEITSSGPFFIEVNSKGVDKGLALEMLCQLLNIDIQDTMAFGDAENDIPLLKAAGLAVVMCNGTEETKMYADEITFFNNDEDGLRKTLEKYFE